MTNIVDFRPRRSGRTRRTEHGEAGRILLFTGVRYIRDHDASASNEFEAVAPAVDMAPKGHAATERLLA